MKTSKLIAQASFALLAASLPAMAAPPVPDASQTLQELSTPPQPPSEKNPLQISIPKQESEVRPGGPEVMLERVVFSGNTVFSDTTLQEVIGPVQKRRFDLAGLRGLADKVAAYYRAHGYPFIRVFVPPQTMSEGALHITVLEGHYGRVEPVGEGSIPHGSTPFLSSLQPGQLIESAPLERAMLILNDQPGMRVTPYIRPGQEVGSGDLIAKVDRESRFAGEVGVDNTGNQFTGEDRAHVAVAANSPFLFGDKLSFNSILTNQHMWLGSLAYELPLGGSGLRGLVSYEHTYYQLGDQYAALDASGFAKVSTAKLSYPLIRSQATNVVLAGSYQHKNLEDHYGSTDTTQDKHSDSWPVVLQFDHRDWLGAGGVTYGALGWTSGKLDLDNALAAVDAVTARTAGHFDKFNLDVARIQKLNSLLALYGRFSGQWSDKNLDSSEKLGLGGVYGVRAYPLGEGMGDRGWLIQTELRYLHGPFTPFIFYDAGRIDQNAKPWDANSGASRSISGAGIGARLDYPHWSVDASLAWRIQGSTPQADTENRNPRLWVMAAYRF